MNHNNLSLSQKISRLDDSALRPATMLGQHSLQDYHQRHTEALDHIVRHLNQVHKPSSGVRPAALAGAFRRVSLEEPLHCPRAVLDELSDLYLRDAVYFHHPRYVAHLNCPVTLPAITADMIQATINTSVDTWDQSAGGTLIEQKLIDWTCERIGFDDQADGIFTSGGTQSNLQAMLLARDHYALSQLGGYSIKDKGLPEEARRFRIFVSEYSHFSTNKAAAVLGLGYDAVVTVAGDKAYRMDARDLATKLNQAVIDGYLPIAVVATAGTTDFGSIDPLHEIADLCEQHNIWLHVDAAYGCGLLTSRQYRHKLDGIERADSVTVDYHKSFFQPVSCSAFIARNGKHLGVVTHHADYLNPLQAAQEGTPDLVNKSMQTTRRFDALKLWMTLREFGADGLGECFEAVMHSTQDFWHWMSGLDEIDCLHEPELSTLVFRFCPRDSDASGKDLDDCNRAIRKALASEGETLIAATRVGGRQYLKFTILNPATRMDDIRAIVSRILFYGREFWFSSNQPFVKNLEVCE